MKKVGYQPGWDWPMCKGLITKKIRKEDCPKVLWIEGQDSIAFTSGRYCGVPDKGYFKAFKMR